MLDDDVSYANQLVREVRESKGLKLKQVAIMTGYSTSAINRYELDQAPVPVDYVARMFRATGDLRLPQLVWPGLTVASDAATPQTRSIPPQRTPPAGDPRQLIPCEIEAIESAAKAARYVERVVRDGMINDNDDHSLTGLQTLHNQIREIIGQVDRALMAWRELNGQSGNRR